MYKAGRKAWVEPTSSTRFDAWPEQATAEQARVVVGAEVEVEH